MLFFLTDFSYTLLLFENSAHTTSVMPDRSSDRGIHLASPSGEYDSGCGGGKNCKTEHLYTIMD